MFRHVAPLQYACAGSQACAECLQRTLQCLMFIPVNMCTGTFASCNNEDVTSPWQVAPSDQQQAASYRMWPVAIVTTVDSSLVHMHHAQTVPSRPVQFHRPYASSLHACDHLHPAKQGCRHRPPTTPQCTPSSSRHYAIQHRASAIIPPQCKAVCNSVTLFPSHFYKSKSKPRRCPSHASRTRSRLACDMPKPDEPKSQIRLRW